MRLSRRVGYNLGKKSKTSTLLLQTYTIPIPQFSTLKNKTKLVLSKRKFNDSKIRAFYMRHSFWNRTSHLTFSFLFVLIFSELALSIPVHSFVLHISSLVLDGVVDVVIVQSDRVEFRRRMRR